VQPRRTSSKVTWKGAAVLFQSSKSDDWAACITVLLDLLQTVYALVLALDRS
jgi:hypothetical protein